MVSLTSMFKSIPSLGFHVVDRVIRLRCSNLSLALAFTLSTVSLAFSVHIGDLAGEHLRQSLFFGALSATPLLVRLPLPFG